MCPVYGVFYMHPQKGLVVHYFNSVPIPTFHNLNTASWQWNGYIVHQMLIWFVSKGSYWMVLLTVPLS